MVSLDDLLLLAGVLLPRLANWDSDSMVPVLGVVKPLVKSKPAGCVFISGNGRLTDEPPVSS